MGSFGFFNCVDHVAQQVQGAVAQHGTGLTRVVDGKADAVRHRVAGGDGLAEAGQIFRQLLRRQGAGLSGVTVMNSSA